MSSLKINPTESISTVNTTITTEDNAKKFTEGAYNVRQVINIHHPISKAQPLLFFMDLEKF